MPANALPVPHRSASMAAALPGGATGFALDFGTYEEASFVGMTVKVSLTQPLVHVTTGDVTQVTWTATVGPDGTASIGPLPYNDDPAFWPTTSNYVAEWQALSYKATPGNKQFYVKRTAGDTVDYDLIGTPDYTPTSTTFAQAGSAVVGISIVG